MDDPQVGTSIFTEKTTEMSKEKVDEAHLELVDMRLEIDVEKLTNYLVDNSEGVFPAGPVAIKQFNKGQSNPTCVHT
jgi:hypothetical protein